MWDLRFLLFNGQKKKRQNECFTKGKTAEHATEYDCGKIPMCGLPAVWHPVKRDSRSKVVANMSVCHLTSPAWVTLVINIPEGWFVHFSEISLLEISNEKKIADKKYSQKLVWFSIVQTLQGNPDLREKESVSDKSAGSRVCSFPASTVDSRFHNGSRRQESIAFNSRVRNVFLLCPQNYQHIEYLQRCTFQVH